MSSKGLLKTTVVLLLAFVSFTACPAMAGKVKILSEYRQQIVELREDEKIQIAFEHVLTIEPRSLDDLIELTQIPAPPFGEGARARRFAELLKEAGLDDVIIDEVGNVIGRRPGAGGKRVIGRSFSKRGHSSVRRLETRSPATG